jgi:phosphoesterase RecJ-like protein
MPKNVSASALAGLLRRSRRVVLTTHTRPDADGLGSEIALARVLRRMGKTCHVINASPASRNLNFLQRPDEVQIYRPRRDNPLIAAADVIIAIDVGCADKMEALRGPIMASRAVKVLMDHHVKRDREFDLHWVEEKISSSGEMTYLLVRKLGARHLSAGAATAIYTAIIHDTGNFNYDRTSAQTFRIAAELVKLGVQPYRVFKAKHCSREAGQLRFIGEALSLLRLTPSGRVAWCSLPCSMLRRHRVDEFNIPRVIDQVLTLKSIEVALLFTEIRPGLVKGSARSKTYVDVSRMAQEFGGGGHRKSAGFTLRGPLAAMARKVVRKAEAAAARGTR